MAVAPNTIKPPPSPSDRLNAAIQDFQASLPSDEQQRLRAIAVVPTAEHVVSFVSSLDREAGHRITRTIGPRVVRFLGGVQEFSGILDTFSGALGGIGALVWGTVKLSLLLLNNVLSYRETFSELIMEIGRQTPVLARYGALYHDLSVQKALCDYYTVVVELCTAIVVSSRRNFMWKTISSAFKLPKSEFESFANDLKLAAESVENMCQLTMREQIVQFGGEVKSLRQDAMRVRRKSREWRMQQQRFERASLLQRIEDLLVQSDPRRVWHHVLAQRAANMAQWFQQDAVFVEFQRPATSAAFWCRGNLGSGKTVLLASMIEHLHIANSSKATIAWHFCDREQQSSLTVRSVVGQLVHQLLGPFFGEASFSDLQSLEHGLKSAGSATLIDLLVSRMHFSQMSYVFLDGLDQCRPEDQAQILVLLRSLLTRSPHCVKLMIGAQPDIERCIAVAPLSVNVMQVDSQRNQKDIEQYASLYIRDRVDRGDVVFRDIGLEAQILEVVKTGAQGMFLWCSLFLEDVCAQVTDDDVRNCLSNPPKRIVELVDRLLLRLHQTNHATLALKLLEYCASVKRPLTASEYAELLSLEEEQDCLDRGKLVNNMTRVINHTMGLVYIDESPQTVHILHHSIQQHLVSPAGLGTTPEEASRKLGALCVTYLEFNDHKRQLAVIDRPKYAGTSSAPLLGLLPFVQALPPALSTRGTVMLSRKSKGITESANKTHSLVQYTAAQAAQHKSFSFLKYAQDYWIWHFEDVRMFTSDFDTPQNQRLAKKIKACLLDTTGTISRPWLNNEVPFEDLFRNVPPYSERMFIWLCVFRNFPALAMVCLRLLVIRFHDEQAFWVVRETCSRSSYEVVVELFRVALATVHVHALQYALHEFLTAGNVPGVEALLEALPDLQSDKGIRGKLVSEALATAAIEGRQEIVDKIAMTERCYTVQAGGIMAAAANGHLGILRTLIKLGGSPNADDRGNTALQLAASRGRIDTLQYLLSVGANVNTCNYGSKPLRAAASMDHADAFEILLDNGASLHGFGPEIDALPNDARAGKAGAMERAIAAVKAIQPPLF